MRQFYLFVLTCFFSVLVNAQTNRFNQEVFTEQQIIVDSNIIYGTAMNFSPAVMIPLHMDVYHANPSVDTLKNRPVIIILHAGSFLPAYINAGSPSNGGAYLGTRRDSAIVEMCRQFAKRGWVAIAGTYRIGWIANSPSSNTQKVTIMRAVYRAILDSRTLIRYMRKSIDSMGNKFNIDADKIVLGGPSSGAYIGLGASNLDDVSDIFVPGLLDSIGNTILDTTILGGFTDGDHQGYNSKPNMVISIGGAVIDTAIMSSTDAPIIAFHGVMDPTTPYNRGIVKNAGTLTPITTVDGTNVFMLAAKNKGISNKVILAGGTGSRPGFYPFENAGFDPGGWYNKPPLFAPTNTKPRALLYIDTIMDFFTPFAVKILDLKTNDPSSVKLIKSLGFSLYPNPASQILNIEVKPEYSIGKIQIISIDGKVIHTERLANYKAVINIENMNTGIYTVLVETTGGVISRQLYID